MCPPWLVIFILTILYGTDTRINYIQVFEEFAYNFPKTYNVEFNDSVLAIGNFDGLHLGHQEVINEAKKISLKFN